MLISLEETALSKHDFEKLLLEAIDEGLGSLGDSSRQSIYFHLDKSFNIKKDQIPEKIHTFESAIESIFGLGANFLELLIMRRLHEKVGQEVEMPVSETLVFAEYVDASKRQFLKTQNVNAAMEVANCRRLDEE